jgi:lysophospholipase L1-like esterase
MKRLSQTSLAGFFNQPETPALSDRRPVQPAMLAKISLCLTLVMFSLIALMPQVAQAVEYPYAPYNEGKMDPQLKGWPLTEAERAYVIKPENIARMPGREPGAHGDLPAMWPVTPSAGYWGGTNATDTQWLDHHTTLVNMVQSNQGPVDIVLVGDSITQGWGGGWEKTPFNLPWQTHFSQYQTLNLGIGGDRTEHILWRLDHGGLDGMSPKVVVLLIGVNDTPMITPNGIPPAAVAEGIKLCVLNVKEKCPKAQVVVVKILPGFKSDTAVHKDVQRVNAALDELNLGKIPGVHVLDLQQELANADGSVKPEAYNGDHLHLNETGYDIFASRLQPLITELIGRRGNSTGDADLPCSIRLSVVEEHPEALIKKGTPGTEGIKYGLEGGSAIKLDGVYHVFTAEMLGDPQWVKMRLGHWTSTNRLNWTRVGTMYESSGDPTGKDPRASFWSPMPIYDEKQKLWNFFYVAYRAQVGPLGWNGRVWRAISKVKGPEGINGPWEDVGVILQPGPAGGAWEDAVMSGTVDSKTILQPGPESDPWEGSQGVDSFYPYKVGGKWMGFYGSCNGHSWFKVGLAEASKLAGPWKRCSALNPVTIAGTRGTENPVVTRLKSGRYVALFEIIARENGFGYAESMDGIHWSKAKELLLQAAPHQIRKVRTPLGLVAEPDGTFTVFFTGYTRTDSWGEVWMVRVKVEE